MSWRRGQPEWPSFSFNWWPHSGPSGPLYIFVRVRSGSKIPFARSRHHVWNGGKTRHSTLARSRPKTAFAKSHRRFRNGAKPDIHGEWFGQWSFAMLCHGTERYQLQLLTGIRLLYACVTGSASDTKPPPLTSMLLPLSVTAETVLSCRDRWSN